MVFLTRHGFHHGMVVFFFCMLQLPIKRKSDSLLVIIQNSRCNQIEFLDDYIGGDSPPNYIKNHVRQSSIIFLNFRGGRDGERITTLRKTSSRNNNTNTFLRWHLNPPLAGRHPEEFPKPSLRSWPGRSFPKHQTMMFGEFAPKRGTVELDHQHVLATILPRHAGSTVFTVP